MLLQAAGILWWAVPVCAALIALYLLKMRRSDATVPALFLWPQIMTDVRANALFQKLRPNLLLFLQLLFLCLLIFALARPSAKSSAPIGSATAIVIDASASMKAKDAAPSRFDAAKNRALALVGAMSPTDQIAVISASAEAKSAASLTSDKKRLQDAIRSLTPQDAASDMGEALRLASALVGQRDGSKILLLSDGAFQEVANFSPGKAAVTFESFGSTGENVGIVALDSSETATGARSFASIKNFGAKPAEIRLGIYADGSLIDAKDFTVQPGRSVGHEWSAPKRAEWIEARIETDDALESDNRAYWYAGGGRKTQVLLIGAGNFFLERALSLEPTIDLDKASTVPETARKEARYDIAIFDGVQPQPVNAKGIWMIGGQPHEMAQLSGELKEPSLSTSARNHPIMRHAELGAAYIEKAVRATAADWATPLAESGDAALIIAGERSGQRRLWMAWDIMQSDVALQPGFPIFAANAVRWLAGETRENRGFAARTGQPIRISHPSNNGRFQLQLPNGSIAQLTGGENGVSLREAVYAGQYRLKGEALDLTFALSLLNQQESNIQPQKQTLLGGKTTVASGRALALKELWLYFAFLALMLLAVEWLVFIRRS